MARLGCHTRNRRRCVGCDTPTPLKHRLSLYLDSHGKGKKNFKSGVFRRISLSFSFSLVPLSFSLYSSPLVVAVVVVVVFPHTLNHINQCATSRSALQLL